MPEEASRPTFRHFDLKITAPTYEAGLTDIIFELEKLRHKSHVPIEVPAFIFEQLKDVFHLLENLESVRIEGNNTTLSDLIEKSIEGELSRSKEEKFREIANSVKALRFIESNTSKGSEISEGMIREIHNMVVEGLDPQKEGDPNPGRYRVTAVAIKNSLHLPPFYQQVPEYMKELIDFVNQDVQPKNGLLVIAVAHHRFAWIHPFRNGNGRVVRLLTYAMLIRQGFHVGRILNPTAVFCNDRDLYYRMLAVGDKGTSEGILAWSEYVLENLLKEINKIDKLLNKKYLFDNILLPALNSSLKKKVINKNEAEIIKLIYQGGGSQAGDLNKILKFKHSPQVTRFIKKMIDKKMLAKKSPRTYIVSFANNYLLRDVIDRLKAEGFVPLGE